MANHTFGPEYGFATRAVHTGNDIDQDSGAIKRPITMANSYALPYDPTDMNWSSAGGNLYTRNGGTNQKYLQDRIASLEGGEDCVVLASGVAALSGLFFALLNKGDHVIFPSVTYIAVYRLLNELLNNKFGVETTIVSDFSFSKLKERYKSWTGESLDEKELRSFGLVDAKGMLTNAGALMADDSPIRWSRIFCTRWNGLTKGGGDVWCRCAS